MITRDAYMARFVAWLADHPAYSDLAERAFAGNEGAAWQRLDEAAWHFLSEQHGHPATPQAESRYDYVRSELVRELEIWWLNGDLKEWLSR